MKVSVIVPVYNVEKYIEKCLDSLIEQEFKDYEILVIDDGSVDKSADIIKKYVKKHSFVHYFYKKNGGLSNTRNYGIERAKGEYITFVDSDDYVSKSFLKLMYEKAYKEKSDIVICEFNYVYDNGLEVRSHSNLDYTSSIDKKYLLTPQMATIRMFKKELFKNLKFKENIFYEDLEICPKFLNYTKKISYVNEGLYYYVMHNNSIMHQKTYNNHLLDIYKVLDSNYELLISSYPEEIEYLYIIHLLRTASLRFLDYKEGKSELKKIVSIMKDKFPNWSDNIYFKKSNIKIKIICYLAFYKCSLLLKIIKNITGK